MGVFYSVKAVDSESGIMFVVEHDKGKSFMPANMNFYLEVSESDAEDMKSNITCLAILEELEIPIAFIDRGWSDVDNQKVISIPYERLKHKYEIMKLFPEVTFFNADISEEMLWLIKHKHEYGDFLAKALWFDIEVDPTNLDMNDLTYDNRIYMIGMANEFGKTYPIIYDDERRMLREAYAIAKTYRVLIGWNSKHFDIPYLQGRSKALGLGLDWEGIPHIDQMISYKMYMKFKKELGEVIDGGLEEASKKILGSGKIAKTLTKLKDWFENDRLSLETYCMNDVLLMVDIYNALEGLKRTMKSEMLKVKIANLQPNKRFITAFLDNKFNELALNHKMAIPRRYGWVHRDIEEESTEVGAGGYVPEPIKGMHKNIVSIDFYSLYPNIYITHNIGINTVDWNDESDDVIKTEVLSFVKDRKGLNAEFMDYLLSSRRQYRSARDRFDKGTEGYVYNDLYQDMYKLLLVGANGAMENKNFRYKNQQIYNSCTETGQVYLQFLREAGEILGWEMIGGDTDSCHFKTPYDDINDIVAVLPEAQKFIYEYVKQQAILRWDIPEEFYTINPRCEAISSHFYYIAKKSYIHKIVWVSEDELGYGRFLDEQTFNAKGMPGVKYNTLPLLKTILQGIFKEVVFEVPAGDDYIDAAVDYLLRLKDDLYNSRRDELLMFSQEVSKLGGRLPHDRAAAEIDARGLFEPGMMVKYIRRKDGSIIVPEYEDDYIVGRETYDFYWNTSVSSWIAKLLPDVAVQPELGFNLAALNKELDWL